MFYYSARYYALWVLSLWIALFGGGMIRLQPAGHKRLARGTPPGPRTPSTWAARPRRLAGHTHLPWCGVCPALGARGELTHLAAALGQAGLQHREPRVCGPMRQGLQPRAPGQQTPPSRSVITTLGFRDLHSWIGRPCI